MRLGIMRAILPQGLLVSLGAGAVTLSNGQNPIMGQSLRQTRLL